MSRVKINISNFKYPRIKMEQFSLTKKEEVYLNNELNKLETMFPGGFQSIFSVSKKDGFFCGSLKIKSSNIYSYGKPSTAISLFCKLREMLKLKSLEQNKLTK